MLALAAPSPTEVYMLNLEEGLSSSLQTPKLPPWHVGTMLTPGLRPASAQWKSLTGSRRARFSSHHASRAITLRHRELSPSEASETCSCL